MTDQEAIDNLQQLEPLSTRYLHKDYEKAIKQAIKALEERVARQKGA